MVLLLTASGLLLAAVPLGPGVWVTAVLVVGLAVLALVSSGRTPFRAAMAIALVDVVLLAVAL